MKLLTQERLGVGCTDTRETDLDAVNSKQKEGRAFLRLARV